MSVGAFARTLIESEVRLERERQEAKFGPADTCANPAKPNVERLAILAEEFGEVAKEVTELMVGAGDLGRLRRELIQVAAVSVAWIEGLSAGREGLE